MVYQIVRNSRTDSPNQGACRTQLSISLSGLDEVNIELLGLVGGNSKPPNLADTLYPVLACQSCSRLRTLHRRVPLGKEV